MYTQEITVNNEVGLHAASMPRACWAFCPWAS